MSLSVHAAFADGEAGGNIAGVVLTAAALPDDRMRAIARDLALPTVAFATADSGAEVPVRLFTADGEIAACGHASAAVAAERYRASGGRLDRTVTVSPGGPVAVTVDGPLERPTVSLTVPVLGWSIEPLPPDLTSVLDAPIEDDLPLGRVDTGLTHLVVGVTGRADLHRMTLDHDRWRAFGRSIGVDTIGVVAVGPDRRVELRDICAPIGDTEEAASGTTASAVSWHLHRLGSGHEFDIGQGVAMGRPSRLRTSVHDRGVTVQGLVRRMASGHLQPGTGAPRSHHQGDT